MIAARDGRRLERLGVNPVGNDECDLSLRNPVTQITRFDYTDDRAADVRSPDPRLERPKQRGHPVNPYEQGQIDAQRTSPQPPNYSDPDDIAAYLDGWRVIDPDRPCRTSPESGSAARHPICG